jgi:hypothetical protein
MVARRRRGVEAVGRITAFAFRQVWVGRMNEVLRLTRSLVEAVIAGREDAAIVRPVVTVMVQTAIRDFGRYYDARLAATRIRDFDILMARNKAAKATASK